MRVSSTGWALREGGVRRWVGRAAGGVLAVLALVACSDAGTGPTAAKGPRATGEVVAGTMFHSGRLTMEDETVQSFTLPSHSFAVPMDGRGIAGTRLRAAAASLEEAVAGLTPVVAVEARGMSAQERRTLSFVDPSGQRHQLDLVTAGGRVLRAEHRVDGELFTRVDRQWGQQGGFWRLQNASLSVQHGGRRVDIASNLWSATATAGIAIPVTNGAQPEFGYYLVEEDNALSCWGATLNLFAASGALATAIGTGNPVAIVIALAYYLAAVDQYHEECG